MNTLRPARKGCELYNLEEDPGEKKNLYKIGDETSQELKAVLNQRISNQLHYYRTPELYRHFYLPRYESSKPPEMP